VDLSPLGMMFSSTALVKGRGNLLIGTSEFDYRSPKKNVGFKAKPTQHFP